MVAQQLYLRVCLGVIVLIPATCCTSWCLRRELLTFQLARSIRHAASTQHWNASFSASSTRSLPHTSPLVCSRWSTAAEGSRTGCASACWCHARLPWRRQPSRQGTPGWRSALHSPTSLSPAPTETWPSSLRSNDDEGEGRFRRATVPQGYRQSPSQGQPKLPTARGDGLGKNWLAAGQGHIQGCSFFSKGVLCSKGAWVAPCFSAPGFSFWRAKAFL